MTEVCYGVGTESCLQPITDEVFSYRIASKDDGARLDIVAESFWGRDRQRDHEFFDVRVFNPLAPSYRIHLSLTVIVEMSYKKEEPMTKESEK